MGNWNPKPVFVDGKYITHDTWYDADGKPFQPQVHNYAGGATKMYGAGTSFFPSIGAVNPALTAMANAIRVGEHLTGRLA
jgi:hypothetical protein